MILYESMEKINKKQKTKRFELWEGGLLKAVLFFCLIAVVVDLSCLFGLVLDESGADL